MKKKLCLLLSLIMTTSLFAACGSESNVTDSNGIDSNNSVVKQEEKVEKLDPLFTVEFMGKTVVLGETTLGEIVDVFEDEKDRNLYLSDSNLVGYNTGSGDRKIAGIDDAYASFDLMTPEKNVFTPMKDCIIVNMQLTGGHKAMTAMNVKINGMEATNQENKDKFVALMEDVSNKYDDKSYVNFSANFENNMVSAFLASDYRMFKNIDFSYRDELGIKVNDLDYDEPFSGYNYMEFKLDGVVYTVGKDKISKLLNADNIFVADEGYIDSLTAEPGESLNFKIDVFSRTCKDSEEIEVTIENRTDDVIPIYDCTLTAICIPFAYDEDEAIDIVAADGNFKFNEDELTIAEAKAMLGDLYSCTNTVSVDDRIWTSYDSCIYFLSDGYANKEYDTESNYQEFSEAFKNSNYLSLEVDEDDDEVMYVLIVSNQ